jgi:hypothetical protein
MTVEIYGASDDLVEVSGCKGADEFYISGDQWHGELVAPDGEQLAVHVGYSAAGCWWVGVSQVDETVKLPSWPITVSQHENGYSALMRIEAPDATRLTNVK